MDKTGFELAKKLSAEIESKQTELRRVELLLKSCGLEITIAGTPPGRFVQTEYKSFNNTEIRPLLEREKERLLQQLEDMNIGLNLLIK